MGEVLDAMFEKKVGFFFFLIQMSEDVEYL